MNNESVLQMQRTPSAVTDRVRSSAKTQNVIKSTPIYENDATVIFNFFDRDNATGYVHFPDHSDVFGGGSW